MAQCVVPIAVDGRQLYKTMMLICGKTWHYSLCQIRDHRRFPKLFNFPNAQMMFLHWTDQLSIGTRTTKVMNHRTTTWSFGWKCWTTPFQRSGSHSHSLAIPVPSCPETTIATDRATVAARRRSQRKATGENTLFHGRRTLLMLPCKHRTVRLCKLIESGSTPVQYPIICRQTTGTTARWFCFKSISTIHILSTYSKTRLRPKWVLVFWHFHSSTNRTLDCVRQNYIG